VTVTLCIASDAPPGIGSTESTERAPVTVVTHANASAGGAARCNALVASPTPRPRSPDPIRTVSPRNHTSLPQYAITGITDTITGITRARCPRPMRAGNRRARFARYAYFRRGADRQLWTVDGHFAFIANGETRSCPCRLASLAT